MSEREGAALTTEALGVEAKTIGAGEDLAGKRLVELEHIDLSQRQPGVGEGLLDRRNYAKPGPPRIDSSGRRGNQPQAGQAKLAPSDLGDESHHGCAVTDSAGVACGHRATVAEGRLQPGEALEGKPRARPLVACQSTDRRDLFVVSASFASRDGQPVGASGVRV